MAMENETVIFDVNPLKDGKKAIVHNNTDCFVLEYEGEAFKFDTTASFFEYFYYRFFVSERTKSERLRVNNEAKMEHCGAHEYSMDNYYHILTIKISPLPDGVNVAFGKDIGTGKYVMTYKSTQYFFDTKEDMMDYFNKRFVFFAKHVSEKNLSKKKASLKPCRISA